MIILSGIMITVFSTTNRVNSVTRKVAESYFTLLKKQVAEAEFFALEDLPIDFVSSDMYADKSTAFQEIEEQVIRPTRKFVFVIPEYNGSYPGILKTLIDGCDVKRDFYGKKAALVGISSGKTGNLRGLDHFTDVLNHIKVNVLYNKVRVEHVENAFDENGNFVHHEPEDRIKAQIKELVVF